MSGPSQDQERLGQVENSLNTFSRPADLKITDVRCAVVASIYDYSIIRIDTNQGVYGLGEVRDAGDKGEISILLQALAGDVEHYPFGPE